MIDESVELGGEIARFLERFRLRNEDEPTVEEEEPAHIKTILFGAERTE